MYLDGLLQFTGSAPGTSPITGVSTTSDLPTTGTQTSTNVLDLLNARDLGAINDLALQLLVQVMTTFTGGTSLQITIQGSDTNFTNPVTLASGPVVVEANLLAGTRLFDIDLPRIAGAFADRPGATEALPRYLRLQ